MMSNHGPQEKDYGDLLRVLRLHIRNTAVLRPMTKTMVTTPRDGQPTIPSLGKTRAAVAARVEKIHELEAQGYTSNQIARVLGMKLESLKKFLTERRIDIRADRVAGRQRSLNHTRLMDRLVLDAEHLIADFGLVVFDQLDDGRLDEWFEALTVTHKELTIINKKLLSLRRTRVKAVS